MRSQQTAFVRRVGADGEPRTEPLSLPQLRQLVAAQEMALVSGRQAALESTTACLRRVFDAAPTVCHGCGGAKPMAGAPDPAGGDCRRELTATGREQSAWTD